MAKLLIVGFDDKDIYLHGAPLFHVGEWLHCFGFDRSPWAGFPAYVTSVFGITSGGLSSAFAILMAGARHVFCPRFSAAAFSILLQEHMVQYFRCLVKSPLPPGMTNEALLCVFKRVTQATAFIALPVMLSDMVQPVPVRGNGITPSLKRFPSVRRVLIGGGGVSAMLQRSIRFTFPGASFFTAYGMTEACSSITFGTMEMEGTDVYKSEQSQLNCSSSSPHCAGSCVGRPPPGTQVAILTGDGEVANTGAAARTSFAHFIGSSFDVDVD
jgi:o-succinylbenzoate---CoA ligase